MNPVSKSEIVDWRKAERKRLLEFRVAHSNELGKIAKEIAYEIEQLSELRSGLVVSFYWPLPGELDFLFWMRSLSKRDIQIALPVVISKSTPMIFRGWTPDSQMIPGKGKIPVPRDGLPIVPDVVISPLVGFDAECYRLGYGSGCFDRTLASLTTEPTVIGVGHPLCEIDSIHPQAHDIPMDVIVTGVGKARYRNES